MNTLQNEVCKENCLTIQKLEALVQQLIERLNKVEKVKFEASLILSETSPLRIEGYMFTLETCHVNVTMTFENIDEFTYSYTNPEHANDHICGWKDFTQAAASGKNCKFEQLRIKGEVSVEAEDEHVIFTRNVEADLSYSSDDNFGMGTSSFRVPRAYCIEPFQEMAREIQKIQDMDR